MPERLLFIGSKTFGLECLKAIQGYPKAELAVVSIGPSNDSRDIPEAFQAHCHDAGIPITMLPYGRGLHKQVKDFHPSMCVVSGWYWLIRPETLALAPKGFIGTHASLLPKYRGGAPLVWAIINGDQRAGTTLFRFDEGMDSGDIIGQAAFEIAEEDTIAEVIAKAESASIELLKIHLGPMLRGTASLVQQDHGQATYCAQRRPEDGRIDWSLSAAQISGFIRAQTRPYPGAFYFDENGNKVTVWKARPFHAPCQGTPGQVMYLAGHPVVACGSNALVLIEVEPHDKEACPAESVLKQGDKLL